MLPHAPPPVAAMVRLQALTGMRPGEVIQIRAGVAMIAIGAEVFGAKGIEHDKDDIAIRAARGRRVLADHRELRLGARACREQHTQRQEYEGVENPTDVHEGPV